MPIGILGTGSYLPENEVSNAALAPRAGVDEEWIIRKTNIRGRRFAADDQATSDLAAAAGRAAIEQAGLSPEDIDVIIVSTSTPDSPQPPTASVVQYLLGAVNAYTFDVNAVCTGFVHALEVARNHVVAHPAAKVLVIAAELYSRYIDFTDRRTAVLMADGAGAAVVGQVSEGYGILGLDLTTDGRMRQLIRIDAGGSRLPASRETVESGAHFVKMEGRQVREFVLEHVAGAQAVTASRAGIPFADVAHIVPHQPNGRLLDELAEQGVSAGFVNATTHHTVERFGNVGSASIPITLDEIVRTGALRDGELVLLTGFGGGMAMGHCLLRWQQPAALSGTGDLAA